MIFEIEVETGEVGVNISTSLAIEGLCGVYPDRPVNPAPILEVKVLWLNINTLVRNLYNSSKPIFESQRSAEWLSATVVQEIETIDGFIKLRNPDTVVMPYWIDDAKAKKMFDWMVFKEPSEKVKPIYDKLCAAAKQACKAMPSAVELPMFNVTLTGPTAVLTHYPLELATQVNTKDLVLLESHTGKIKFSSEWHSKMMLHTGVEVPFNKLMLSLCGDKHQIKPAGTLKRRLMKLARENKWHKATPVSKIILEAQTKEKDLYDYLKKYEHK